MLRDRHPAHTIARPAAAVINSTKPLKSEEKSYDSDDGAIL